MSPHVMRRQADRFGTSAPKRVSRKRRSDVWSKPSDDTKPPRLNGEMMSVGTRGPSPIGPAIPTGERRQRIDGEEPPGVPEGAGRRLDVIEEAAVLVVGEKHHRVRPHSPGAALSACTTWLTAYSPRTGVLSHRMLELRGGRDHPRDLRQRSGGRVGEEVGEDECDGPLPSTRGSNGTA